MYKISICIATWNRKEKLKTIIEKLENQTMPQEDYEIIVVDSCSPDGTCDMIKQLKYNNIVYIHDADNILATKRNVGIKYSTTDIIVFMDDDVIPCEAFVESHYRANRDNKQTFFCGQIRFPKELVLESNYYHYRDAQHLGKESEGKELPFNNIVVMNLSFRKEYIKDIGWVDERFLGYGGEDIEFGYRIIESGYKMMYLPEALGVHVEESSNIKEYGKKLYKSGLYGERTIRGINPNIIKKLGTKRKIIGKCASIKHINYTLEKYLISTDKKPKLYNPILFKLYLLGCEYRGISDQKNQNALDRSSIKSGW